MNAEIVVTFEGTTEFGNPFMARQSYLMDEIMWGHQFAQIIHPPETDDTKYRIDFSRYHVALQQTCGLLFVMPNMQLLAASHSLLVLKCKEATKNIAQLLPKQARHLQW